MPRWIALFEDNPEAAAVREAQSEAHLAWLDHHRDRILLAGGLRDAPGERPTGGLWIMEVASREDAVRLCEGDPFFRHGLRRSYRLLAWGKAFPDRLVVL